jgi:hypothetical protein
MTTYTVIRREVESTTDPNLNPSSTTQTGSGNSWSGGGFVNLTNSAPNSKTYNAFFQTDFRTTDDLYNIPADRCIVRYKARPFIDLSTISGGSGTNFDVTYTTGSIFGSSTTNTSPFLSDSNFGLTDLIQTGSAVTTQTAGRNDITEDQASISVQVDTSNSNSNGLHDVTIRATAQILGNTGSAGSLNRKWEAKNHIINGQDGDDDPDLQVSSSLTATGAVLKFGESSSSANFSISEDSVNLKLADSSSSVTGTISFTPTYIADSSRSLSVITELLASTDNLVRLDPVSYSSDFNFTVSPTFKIQGDTILAAEATDSIQGNAIYDIGGEYTWDTINAIAIAAEEKWDDKDSWETWLDNVWDTALETWDEWDQDVWARAYNLAAVFTRDIVSTFKPSASSNISASTSVTAVAGLNEPAEAELTATVTTSFTANGIIDVDCVITDAFTPTLVDTVIFDQPSVIAITGAFTPVLTAAVVNDQDTILSSSFAIDITPTHRRGPYELDLTSVFTQPDTVPSHKVGPYQFVLPALASQLTTAKLFYQADPYNIFTVPAETRTAVIPRESNITLVDQEIRVNKVAAETRLYIVDQETRRFKLRVAPISNRFSTPKERAEA